PLAPLAQAPWLQSRRRRPWSVLHSAPGQQSERDGRPVRPRPRRHRAVDQRERRRSLSMKFGEQLIREASRKLEAIERELDAIDHNPAFQRMLPLRHELPVVDEILAITQEKRRKLVIARAEAQIELQELLALDEMPAEEMPRA